MEMKDFDLELFGYYREQAGCWDRYLSNKLERIVQRDFREEKYFLLGLKGLNNYIIKNKRNKTTTYLYYHIYARLKAEKYGGKTWK